MQQPQTVNIIRVVFEGLVAVIRAIKCKITCSSCKSDCQQRPEPDETIPESQAIKDFYTTLQADITDHKIVKKASV
jgi:hypothetical protein